MRLCAPIEVQLGFEYVKISIKGNVMVRSMIISWYWFRLFFKVLVEIFNTFERKFSYKHFAAILLSYFISNEIDEQSIYLRKLLSIKWNKYINF